MNVRRAGPDDAEALLALKLRLDAETGTMMVEQGERRATRVEEEAALREPGRIVVVAADEDGGFLGYATAQRGDFRRNRHAATVVIGVVPEAWGRGVGSRLLEELERLARAEGVHRLELTVLEDNERAVALYRRLGFEAEGRRRDSLKVEGRYVDELSLAKLL